MVETPNTARSKGDGDQPRDKAVDRLGKRLTAIGSLIAILVGLNTVVTGWLARSEAREQSFRDAVEHEEAFWRDRYGEYVGLFAEGITPDQRRVRLFALEGLTSRPAAHFQEFASWTGDNVPKRQASERIGALRARLVEALSSPELSSPEVARTRQARSFQETIETAGSDQESSYAAVSEPSTTPPTGLTPERVVFGTQVLTVGVPQGWDFDVFWCGNANSAVAARNYRDGLVIARMLAALDRIDTGQGSDPRGRVRLAMLPLSRQGGTYPRTGNGLEIRPDAGSSVAQRAEQGIAARLSRRLEAANVRVRVVPNTMRPSQWYISLFACSGPLDESVPRSNVESA